MPDKYPQIVPYTKYGRVYEVTKGVFFPSVTTCIRYGMPLEEYLLKWFIEQSKGDYQRHIQQSGEASEIGTKVHSDFCDIILDGGEVSVSDNPLDVVPGKGYYPTSQVSLQMRKALLSLMEFWAKNSPKVIAKEMLLFSLETKANEFMYPFMGRCDLICKIGKDVWLLDIKTSKVVKDSIAYSCQLSMYAMIYNNMNPKNPVERIGIVHAKKDWAAKPPKSVLEPIEYQFDANLVRDVYAMFKRTYKGFELGGKPKVKDPIPKTFSLEMING